jgi:hypothetical protein
MDAGTEMQGSDNSGSDYSMLTFLCWVVSVDGLDVGFDSEPVW